MQNKCVVRLERRIFMVRVTGASGWLGFDLVLILGNPEQLQYQSDQLAMPRFVY